MTSSLHIANACSGGRLATTLAGCNEKRDPGFQGWVEADMIFVSPDEAGRVTKLNVREGDEVKVGDPLYSVDDDLQLADLNQTKATLANAQQMFDRADVAAQDRLRHAGDAQFRGVGRCGSRRRGSVTSETRLARRQGFAPVAGTIQQIYFREGEMVAAQRPVLSIMPPGNMKLRFFVPETELPKLSIGDEVQGRLRQLLGRSHRKDLFHRHHGRIHPAGDLQPRRAQQARLSDPGAAVAARCTARRPADLRSTSIPRHRWRTSDERRVSDIAIEVKGLTKSFDGRKVVQDLSMQVKRGTIYGFLGPNGSGKTTTIRMLCGLLTPDSGEGTCLGYDIRARGRQDQAPGRLHDPALFASIRTSRCARTSSSSRGSMACRRARQPRAR